MVHSWPSRRNDTRLPSGAKPTPNSGVRRVGQPRDLELVGLDQFGVFGVVAESRA